MNRRKYLKAMSGTAAIGATDKVFADRKYPSSLTGHKLPHIVIFNPDQFRARALGHLGNPAAVTPNLDDMALTDGVSFSRAFCQNPVCTPSRCSFLTGWYPHVRGHRTMHHMLHKDEPMLLKTLKNKGYNVWWGGKNDVVPGQDPELIKEYCSVKYTPGPDKKIRTNLHLDLSWRAPKGTDHYYSFYAGKLDKKGDVVYNDSDLDNVTEAVRLIENAPDDRPLCIYLPLQYPHPPYGVEEPYYSIINRGKIPKRIPVPDDWKGKPGILKSILKNQNLQNLSESEWTELRAVYHGMCSRIDDQFGMVVNALKKKGLYNDTAVFFFSDHGDFTGDYGLVEKTQNTFEDLLTNVPFIIKPPSWVPVKAGTCDALVELVDFPATVEALTGFEPEHTHFGRSLLPLVSGETKRHRDAVFCEGGQLHGEEHVGEIGTPNSWNQEGLYWPRVSLQKSDTPEATKAVICRTERFKYVMRLYEQDEFYDLRTDSQELHNRIEASKYRKEIAEMKERLLMHYLETSDVVPHKRDLRWPGETITKPEE
ncbi:sulfatase-like hydrolase/transferase [Candidatus Latescibacterota bacterium]